jgi:hypothetical protein
MQPMGMNTGHGKTPAPEMAEKFGREESTISLDSHDSAVLLLARLLKI